MSRPLVKICGVTREQEVEHLAQHRVDFFGMVVDVPSPWAVTAQRAGELSARSGQRVRPTLVTGPHSVEVLARLVDETRAAAIQLGPLSTPEHVRWLRHTFAARDFTIVQEISYRRGAFWKEEHVDDYLAAGADFILLDKLRETARGDSTIPVGEIEAFRARHRHVPFLLAGGVSADNVRSLIAASGAAGVDVCSSVRREGLIQEELVERLLEQLQASPVPDRARPSLRGRLQNLPSANNVIAYLTLGDPPGRFLSIADEVLAAGAVALELGFPSSDAREGAILRASHGRALDAGVDTPEALRMFKAIAQQHPDTPLVAVVQWPALSASGGFGTFLDALADAGAAAVLPVGLPFWQLPEFAAQVHERGLQTVITCPPNMSGKLRQIAFQYASGCLYVPRGRVTGGSETFANVAEFCRLVASETDTPIIVGVGVKEPRDVAEICRTPAKAAAVGTALVDHLAQGGSAGEFVRRLVAR